MVGAWMSTLISFFQTYGVMDFLLPFILIFTILFALLKNIKILGGDNKFNIIIALVLSLLFVIPHVTGSYPLGYDPVQVINESLPSIGLVAVAAVMLLILMGFAGVDFSAKAGPIIALLAIGFVVYIFGSSLGLWVGPWDIFSWWTSDTTELMIIIIVFGLIVYLITKEPGKKEDNWKSSLKDVYDGIAGFFEKRK